MDVFGGFRNIKAEKANAMLKYRRIQRLKAMFRLLELCVFLIILSRFTAYLPALFKLSGDYFRRISITAVNPLFVFFIGNSIVLTLFFKSGTQSKDPDRSANPINDLYEEYAKNSRIKPEIKKEKKQRNCTGGGGEILRCSSSDVASSTLAVVKEKKICRSRSDNLKRLHHHKEGGCRELRRSVTVMERRQQQPPQKEKELGPEEEMSNDEFRRTIEAFITRQQRALREDPDYSSDFPLENS